MTPLYFPYTTVPEGKCDKLTALFGSLTVLGVLPEHTRSHPGVRTITPLSYNDARLRSFLKEYREYGSYNREKVSDFMRGRGDKPFFDRDWATEIRSEILKGVDGEHDSGVSGIHDGDRLLWAMAFLEIAREYDETTRSIDREFAEIEKREKMLFNELKSEEDLDELAIEGTEDEITEDQDEGIRLETRLKAWAELFGLAWPDLEKSGGVFFLTDNPGVIECFDVCGKPLFPVSIPPFIPDDPSLFEKGLEMLLTCDYHACLPEIKDVFGFSETKTGACSVSLWIAPDCPPVDFFIPITKGRQPLIQEKKEIRNTVIGLLKV